MVTIVHLVLALILFFLINWIGKQSFSIGYMQLSLFYRTDDAPAFNFVYRILSPVVFIIIISTIFYSIGLDEFVTNIYLVVAYSFLIRILFNIIVNRAGLLNWKNQFLIITVTIILAYFVDKEIISSKRNILPDFDTIANELWIIIALFLFSLFNKMKLSSISTRNRKNDYVKYKLNKFREKYSSIVEKLNDETLESLIYAIMIFEDFNRPKIIRWIENLSFFITRKEHTLGLMQVKTNIYLNDRESVVEATKLIKSYSDNYYKEQKENKDSLQEEFASNWDRMTEIIKKYNIKSTYPEEIRSLQWDIDQIFKLEKEKN